MKPSGKEHYLKIRPGGGIYNIKPVDKNINILKTLTDRGIMNSICSKNDKEQAEEILKKLNVWDYFIFPHINWNSKGPEIKELINEANLRDENVLFIDDNHLNLEEAKYYCKDIKTASPDILEILLSFDALKGKDDSEHTRLKQYKVLEKKNEACKKFNDNLDFLRSSNIQIDIKNIENSNLERVLEMITRTNQLNFTKKRIDSEMLSELIKNPEYENKIIYVKDNFGDYGLSGFYSYNKNSKSLEHFLFSCRILNLGVEQYVYSKLNFPQIEIINPVAYTLKNDYTPDWIKETEISGEDNIKNKTTKAIKALLMGNCDITGVSHYSNNPNICLDFGLTFEKETNIQIRYDSLNVIRSLYSLDEETKKYLINKYFFIFPEIFDNIIFKDNYDVLIISLMYDYNARFFKDIERELIIPGYFYDYLIRRNLDITTAPANKCIKELEGFYIKGIKEEDIEKIRHYAKDCGYIKPEEFKENLEFFISKYKRPVIFINGAEAAHNKDDDEKTKRYIEFNKILDEFIQTHDNCYLLDLRKWVKSKSDMTDARTHYKRYVYINLASELEEMLSNIFKEDLGKSKLTSVLKKLIENYHREIKYKIRFARRKIIWIKFNKNESFIKIFGHFVYKK